jgi:hypothetical protein
MGDLQHEPAAREHRLEELQDPGRDGNRMEREALVMDPRQVLAVVRL